MGFLPLHSSHPSAIFKRSVEKLPMKLKPRHTTITEELETAIGVIVLEDYFDHPTGVSNLYCCRSAGDIVWEAELPDSTDFYTGVRTVDDSTLLGTTWNCFSCSISLDDGRILEQHFTK